MPFLFLIFCQNNRYYSFVIESGFFKENDDTGKAVILKIFILTVFVLKVI